MSVITIDQLSSAIKAKLVNIDNSSTVISSITLDSRAVKPGYLFVALSGTNIDGHQYVQQAFINGAVACVVSDEKFLANKPGLVVPDTRLAWSQLSAYWHGEPAKHMTVIGVTGTSGKTTVQSLIGQALNYFDIPSVRFGTLGTFIDKELIQDSLTTPDAWDLHHSLTMARSQNINHCVLEVSSHGLDQRRVDQLYFNIGIFTNLSRDHLDFHADMECYFLAKLRLFELVASSKKEPSGVVVNTDDPYGLRIRDYCLANSVKCITYGGQCSDIELVDLSLSTTGSHIALKINNNIVNIKSSLIGTHNAYNLMAVIGTLMLVGYNLEQILSCVTTLKPTVGRLEKLGTEDLPVYVDYSHKPDALQKVLQALRPICKGKLWVVFGCGGDRDRGKRPEMGKIASLLADRVVVTSDNPRTENPQAIINEILQGVDGEHYVEADRKKAIYYALSKAQSGDVVLVAGKGHEDYQILGKDKIHFSDQEVIRNYMANRQ